MAIDNPPRMKLPDNPGLRKALDLKGLNVIDHRTAVEGLRSTHGHSIRFEGFHAEETCVPFALDLTDEETYEAIRRIFRSIYAGPEFVQWLLGQGHLQATAPRSGCLVAYFSDGTFLHVARLLTEDIVVSKWGTYPR